MVGCLPLADTARTTKNANNAREAAPVAIVDDWNLDEIGTTGRERSRLMMVQQGSLTRAIYIRELHFYQESITEISSFFPFAKQIPYSCIHNDDLW